MPKRAGRGQSELAPRMAKHELFLHTKRQEAERADRGRHIRPSQLLMPKEAVIALINHWLEVRPRLRDRGVKSSGGAYVWSNLDVPTM